MNDTKQQKLLASQSALALKVFDCVPINESWDTSQIMSELRRTNGSAASVNTVRACLGALEDQRLVRQTSRNQFQRHEVKNNEPKESKPVRETILIAQPQPAPTSMEMLTELAEEVVAMAEDFSTRLKQLAYRIENAALAAEQEREAIAAKLATLSQLQTLLKTLGE